MTRRRWIADEYTDSTAALTGANAAHLARVLRAKVGQQFDLVCGSTLRLGTITNVAETHVEFSLGDILATPALHAQPEIVLLVAIYKFDRFEWAIEKATELGVTRIVPVVSRRTEAHLATAAAKRVERWRRIAHEAAQQSRRIAAPIIDEPRKLSAAFSGEATTRLVLDETEHSHTLREALTNATAPLALAIGPEGGWTVDELAWFAQNAWQPVTLGTTILRAETAAIAALAVVQALL